MKKKLTYKLKVTIIVVLALVITIFTIWQLSNNSNTPMSKNTKDSSIIIDGNPGE